MSTPFMNGQPLDNNFASIRTKSKKNRKFFDNLMRFVWCECKKGMPENALNHTVDDWANVELPAYADHMTNPDWRHHYSTPREMLTPKERNTIHELILQVREEGGFTYIVEAKDRLAPYFGDCMLEALNVLIGRGYDK